MIFGLGASCEQLVSLVQDVLFVFLSVKVFLFLFKLIISILNSLNVHEGVYCCILFRYVGALTQRKCNNVSINRTSAHKNEPFPQLLIFRWNLTATEVVITVRIILLVVRMFHFDIMNN